MKTEQNVQDSLHELLETLSYDKEFGYDFGLETNLEDAIVTTFEQAGILTNNKGLVIQYADGSEFQITIVKSK